MKYKITIPVLVLALIFVLGIYYYDRSTATKNEPNQQTVAAVFPVTVDAFLHFQKEAKAVLAAKGVDVHFYSAEGDPSRFQTVIDAALLKNPNVVIFVGTQLTNIGLSPRYASNLPKVVATAISDPSKVEQLVAVGLEPVRQKSVAILTDMPSEDSYVSGASVIRELLPNVKTVGILFNTAEINSKNTAEKMSAALQNAGIATLDGIVSGEEDVEKVARSLILKGADLLVIPHDKYVIKKAAAVVKVGDEAVGRKVPVFSLDGGTVRKDGAAFGVSVDYGYLGKLTAETSLKILDGEPPEGMPIIRQQKANTYINMETWERLGLPPLPDSLSSSAIIY